MVAERGGWNVGDGNGASGNGSRSNGARMNANGQAGQQPAWNWDDALRGVVPPMITPLDENHAIDAAAVRKVADYIFDGGCTGLFVAGGVGEGAWLSSTQRAALVQASVEAARGRGPVLVGCMLPGTAPAREAAIQAADLGADAIVAGMPYYFAPVDSAAQQRHIESLLQATPLPVLLYNIPQCTHAPLAVDAVEDLSREERVLGIKDSWGNLAFFQALLTIKQQRPSEPLAGRRRPGAWTGQCRAQSVCRPGARRAGRRRGALPRVACADHAPESDVRRCRRDSCPVCRLPSARPVQEPPGRALDTD
jgi:hypothetical protein